jgi:hypothetical protein
MKGYSQGVFMRYLLCFLMICVVAAGGDVNAMDDADCRKEIARKVETEIEKGVARIRNAWRRNNVIDYPLNAESLEEECSALGTRSPSITLKNASLQNLLQEYAYYAENPALLSFFYAKQRRFFAATIICGANPNLQIEKGQNYINPLIVALQRNDEDLVQFLMEYGAHANGMDLYEPYIFKAKKVAIVEQLLARGASISCKGVDEMNLVHQCLYDSSFEPELVDLYKKGGVDPLAIDKRGNTPLHYLSMLGLSNAFLKKAELVLQGLTPAQLIKLCSTQNKDGKTVMALLSGYITKNSLFKSEAQELMDLLRVRLIAAQKAVAPSSSEKIQEEKADNCTICFDLVQEHDGIRAMPCIHFSFHAACIEQWKDVKKECPTCRMPF